MTSIFFLTGIISVVLRFYSRRLTKVSLGADDWFALSSLVCPSPLIQSPQGLQRRYTNMKAALRHCSKWNLPRRHNPRSNHWSLHSYRQLAPAQRARNSGPEIQICFPNNRKNRLWTDQTLYLIPMEADAKSYPLFPVVLLGYDCDCCCLEYIFLLRDLIPMRDTLGLELGTDWVLFDRVH